MQILALQLAKGLIAGGTRFATDDEADFEDVALQLHLLQHQMLCWFRRISCKKILVLKLIQENDAQQADKG